MNSCCANIIDGKQISNDVCDKVAVDVKNFTRSYGITPCIALINIGDDAASKIYVANKVKLAEKLGIKSILYELTGNVASAEIERLIDRLNHDINVHGILLQLPIPEHLNAQNLINLIDPNKDVDGLTWINVGKLSAGIDVLSPCTPTGIMYIIKKTLGDVSGKHAVVIGRSGIVGKPMAQMLLNANCTVTVLHSKSSNAPDICKEADIVVVAIGKSEFVGSEWIKPGALVVDVGINRIEIDGRKKLVGDVNFQKVKDIAGYITPVPGGVGPLTVAFLMHNTLKAAKIRIQ